MNPELLIADCLYVEDAKLYPHDLADKIRTALRAMRDHCADVARDRPFDAEGWIRRVEV